MSTVRQPTVPLYQLGFPARLRVLSGLGQGRADEEDGGGGGGFSYDSGSGGDGSGGGYDWSQYTWGGDTSGARAPSGLPPEMTPPDIGLPPEFFPASSGYDPYYGRIAPLTNIGYSEQDANYIADLVESGAISADDWSAFAAGDLSPDDLRQLYGAFPPNVPLVPGRTQAPGGRDATGGGAPSGGGGGAQPKGPSPTVKTQKKPTASALKPFTDALKRDDLIKGVPNWMVGAGVIATFMLVGGGGAGDVTTYKGRKYRVSKA